MTVCVAVSVDDGIVFAADSAATLLTVGANGMSAVANVYRHGNKVFNLCRGLPICAMTAGMGSIGRAPIHALAKDFRLRLAPGQEYEVDPANYSIEKIVIDARKFLFEDRYRKLETPPPPPHSLEFWIGGFSSGSEQPELWKITLANGDCAAPEKVRAVGDCGLNWGGQPDPINRLLIGFAQATGPALLEAGVAPEQLPNLLSVIQAKTQAPLVVPAMPIQDAIELAEFLVDMTKKFFRFYPGADVVGGETDIAVVTRHEKFKWIKRKHYYRADLNPTELDHV
jgi:hypothetical protein